MAEKKTKEEQMKDMEIGDAESDIYSDAGREELLAEEDEITDVDEGFMQGYEEGEKIAECPGCGAILVNEKVIEQEINDEVHRFCSSQCASEYERKKVKPRE